MRILIVHNAYQQHGGEDTVFASEVALLGRRGHVVETLRETNNDIGGAGSRAVAALLTSYNPAGRRRVADAIATARPDVVHVHNFFPRISPAMFWACEEAGVPSVWTLHNFRVACANGLLFRDGGPCEDCLGGSVLPAVRHRCYRGSLAGTAAVAAMIAAHRAAGTWRHRVTRFVALTEFARDRFIQAGLPAARIRVKANLLEEPVIARDGAPRTGALFVGRLSREKGIGVLVEAWRMVDAPLTVIGDGPERAGLEAVAPPNVRFAGFKSKDEVLAAVAAAECLIVPSLWYENFPMTVVEAMALGTPVIASRLGALMEIVQEGVTGRHFRPGDAADLAAVARQALGDPAGLRVMGASARSVYERSLSPETNLARLEAIYEEAIADVAA